MRLSPYIELRFELLLLTTIPRSASSPSTSSLLVSLATSGCAIELVLFSTRRSEGEETIAIYANSDIGFPLVPLLVPRSLDPVTPLDNSKEYSVKILRLPKSILYSSARTLF